MTIPAHITAAIRSGKFTYCGEAQLSNFGETARKGRYVEFLLDDGPDGSARHPFHGLSCGREKGQRFGLIAVPLGDDDAVAAPEPRTEPKERRDWREVGIVEQAGILCSRDAFQKWAWEQVGSPTSVSPGPAHAAMFLRAECGVESRKELKAPPHHPMGMLWEPAGKFYALEAKFIEDTRLPERH